MTNKKTVKNYLTHDRHDLLNIFSEVESQFDAVNAEISEREIFLNGFRMGARIIIDVVNN